MIGISVDIFEIYLIDENDKKGEGEMKREKNVRVQLDRRAEKTWRNLSTCGPIR